jgi:CRISPR-associated endonuclease/helicase Cas3
MYQFSNIKSHPDLPLESHLSQVADIAINLLENKKVGFSKLGISKTHIKELITLKFHLISFCYIDVHQ